MKKLYTIALAISLATLSATAEEIQLHRDVKGLTQATTVTRSSETRQANLKSISANLSEAKTEKASNVRHAPAKAPEGEWTNIGKGTWAEDFLTLFSDIDAGQYWEVDIEESATTPGYYRILPYQTGPIADMLGADTENYFYIDATNPDKVKSEDFTAFGAFPISQIYIDNGWEEDIFGTLANNIISFPKNSFCLSANGGWYYTCNNEGTKIYLPSAEFKDFSISAVTDALCADNETINFMITTGADVKTVKILLLKGEYQASDGNFAVVAANGQEITANALYSYQCEPDDGMGRYTILAVALDDAGNWKKGTSTYFYQRADKPEEWETVGTADFTDVFAFPSYNKAAENLSATLQQNKSNKDLFRIVNPFENHSMNVALENHDAHNHYIYINTEDPELCYIIDHPLGIDLGSGEASLSSNGYRYLNANYEPDVIKNAGFGGKLADNVISFPGKDVLYAEKGYNNGSWDPASDPLSVKFNITSTGIGSITDNKSESVEYFNLQGMRVTKPENGLFIKRQGNTATKVMIK